MGLAYWVARSASVEELLNNYNIMIDKSFFPWLLQEFWEQLFHQH